jgi:predicted ester cyclase
LLCVALAGPPYGGQPVIPSLGTLRVFSRRVIWCSSASIPTYSIDQMIASGDYVVTRYTATGTHKGDLAGIPPTGRHAETHGCTVGEIKDGKIIRQWIYWDTGHLLRQLGVMPSG